MLWLPYYLGLVGIASKVGASPTSRRAAKPTYHSHPDRVQAVKDAFQKGWNGYYKYAFPHDSLKPVTNKYDDDR